MTSTQPKCDPPAKTIQSLQRGLQIVKTLRKHPEGLGLKALATSLEISSSATHHLVNTLIQEGFCQRLEKPIRYIIGAEGAKASSSKKDIQEIISEGMLKIRKQIPELNVYFSKRVGHQVMIVQQSLSGWGLETHRVVDQSLPPYTSIGGTVHLANWPSNLIREHMDIYAFETYGLTLWGSWSTYESVMKDLKRIGYFFLPCTSPLDLRMGIGVFASDGAFLGSLTISQRLNEGDSIATAREKMIDVVLNEQQNIKLKA